MKAGGEGEKRVPMKCQDSVQLLPQKDKRTKGYLGIVKKASSSHLGFSHGLRYRIAFL